jgi:hypothetical protein
MKGYDAYAGIIKSGGKTRRAAPTIGGVPEVFDGATDNAAHPCPWPPSGLLLDSFEVPFFLTMGAGVGAGDDPGEGNGVGLGEAAESGSPASTIKDAPNFTNFIAWFILKRLMVSWDV